MGAQPLSSQLSKVAYSWPSVLLKESHHSSPEMIGQSLPRFGTARQN